jgi:hypothetical protein
VLKATCEKEHGNSAEDNERLIILSYWNNWGNEQIINGAALICQPLLNIQRSEVTIDESGLLIHVSPGGQLEVPAKITAMDIANAVGLSIHQLHMDGLLPYPLFAYPTMDRSTFQWILASQSSTNAADLSNTDLQAKGAQAVFRGVASQIIKRYLLHTNPTGTYDNVEGKFVFVQQRLFVRLISMRLMETALGLLALTSLLLVFDAQPGSTPQDSASISRIVSLISESTEIMNALASTGSWLTKDLALKLQRSYSMESRILLDSHRRPHPQFVVEGKGGDER